MELIESLNWRYATKKFNTEKVAPDTINQIVTAINLSASSTGLQPYRLFVIENQDLKKELGEGSFNTQIANSSHLLVFAAFEKITTEHIDDYMNHISTVRSIPVENLADFRNAIINGILSRSEEVNFQWAARQAYIGLGTGMIAAAELRVDATPMEGFDAEKFDRLLGLPEKGLKSVVTLALGYRDTENDIFATFKKVRLPEDKFATTLV
ncbi:NAD(P)H-dependent oxidoreductase [Flavobacterium cerinum]|uniref:NAD(P)H-dependent oxidoreductase n=1 Tax=Flavobacterium cerinum TaxID=2502784 RepID=A0ABY5IQQ3_9FLAO|nr:NAD(P)H-dependent oxidoreductase [Flavobacterium cerinum]UUC45180.1 NAD(P)H-dependent oxidoreductase [Flavobacterium cerinum]